MWWWPFGKKKKETAAKENVQPLKKTPKNIQRANSRIEAINKHLNDTGLSSAERDSFIKERSKWLAMVKFWEGAE